MPPLRCCFDGPLPPPTPLSDALDLEPRCANWARERLSALASACLRRRCDADLLARSKLPV